MDCDNISHNVSQDFTSFHDWKARPSGREKGGT
nr:MAG TPA: hypothetical protein [Caudoviricetes sp.]